MPLPEASQRVQRALLERGLTCEVRRLPDSTHTAAQAAAALGCEVAQIAKSLVFRDLADDKALLIIASGANRVDEARVGTLLGTRIEKADADFVSIATCCAMTLSGRQPAPLTPCASCLRAHWQH